MQKWHVRALGAANNLAHPIDGPIATAPDDQGRFSFWTADQFTARRLVAGDIELVPDAPAPAPKAAKAAEPVKEA